MADPQYSLAEVAKITDKSEKTISRWIKSGKLPAIRRGTGYLISGDDIPLKIDSSLDRHAYIQQRLLEPSKEDGHQTVHSNSVDVNKLVTALINREQPEAKSPGVNISSILTEHLRDVEKTIREQNELAEKYARATYKIGQLEERNRLLEENSLKMNQKMALLPPPEQWQSTRKELEDVKQSLHKTEVEHEHLLKETKKSYEEKVQELEEELKQLKSGQEMLEKEKQDLSQQQEQLTEALQAERKKTFWQKLFGS